MIKHNKDLVKDKSNSSSKVWECKKWQSSDKLFKKSIKSTANILEQLSGNDGFYSSCWKNIIKIVKESKYDIEKKFKIWC